MAKLRVWADAHDGDWAPADARQWIVKQNARWSTVHAGDVITSLERDVFPAIGRRAIKDLTARHVLDVLRSVEQRGAIETAHRLRQRISAVFLYGVALGACDNDPAASLGKLLYPVPKAKPQPSIMDGLHDQHARITAIRQLLIDCEAERCRAGTKLALRLIALTAVRPGELAGARWNEFHDLDSDQPLWRIPASRMKGTRDKKNDERKDHFVPLARQAVDVLNALYRLTGDLALCFPSERHVHRPISENTLRALLIRAGYYQRHVPHGFRAAFSTYMNERPVSERQEGDRAVIDLMLAHTPSSKDRDATAPSMMSAAEGAYNRAAYMPRRRQLAQEWADHLLANFWPAEVLLGQPIRWAATGPGRGSRET